MKKILSLCLIILLVLSFTGCSANTDRSADNDDKQLSVQTAFDADEYYQLLENCAKQIREKTDFVPEIALVLGSGLGDYADTVRDQAVSQPRSGYCRNEHGG